MKHSNAGSRPSRLRHVRLPGTVPLPPPAIVRRPGEADEEQKADGADTVRQVLE